jgi:hypothetical protein
MHEHEIWQAIHNLEEQQMSTQAEVDALTTALQQVATDLESDATTLQSELDNLESQITAGNPVDLSALQTAVAALDPKAKAIGALVPEKPAETPVATPVTGAPTPTAGETPTTPAPTEPTQSVYTYSAGDGITRDARFTASGFETGPGGVLEEGEPLYYFAGDSTATSTLGSDVPGYTLFTGTAQPVPA